MVLVPTFCTGTAPGAGQPSTDACASPRLEVVPQNCGDRGGVCSCD